ncbi:MAG: HAMP domain-containing histidine kinase [Lachnospiraceae bacterium]|nr:HAMP domain-containing histidine kinase [Lachnospiraceae bacterium]
MKFKTRLQVTFITIIILPLVLTILAFFIIGLALLYHPVKDLTITEIDYSMMSDGIQSYGKITEELYSQINEEVVQNPEKAADLQYLEEKNKEIRKRFSYLIVRKDKQMYYSGDDTAKSIFESLPAYSEENHADKTFYFNNIQRIVKQINFRFTDGSEGTIFIVTHIKSLISKTLLIDMAIAIVLILVFTSIMLTQWIRRGVFLPVNELNTAMQNIAEGNFEYRLSEAGKGEIGELYHNYEEMRLRLKESAEEKVQQEKQNRELISNISHDLKTPITAIKGYVEGIMDGVADTPEKMDKYIRTVYNKANDMDRLINELTIYSGINSNRIPYNFHRINVADYFKDCIEEVGLDLESKNIELNYSNLVSQDVVVIADPEQMKRVIDNIIGNSVKYMDKSHGVIDIRILDEIDSIRVEIEDNGKGIAAKDLPNIFERFYRTDSSRNSSKGGSGIGLSIVKKIVEDHGGYIWATSKEGEGTCMHFVLRKYSEAKM